jgi:hypothetical protein
VHESGFLLWAVAAMVGCGSETSRSYEPAQPAASSPTSPGTQDARDAGSDAGNDAADGGASSDAGRERGPARDAEPSPDGLCAPGAYCGGIEQCTKKCSTPGCCQWTCWCEREDANDPDARLECAVTCE